MHRIRHIIFSMSLALLCMMTGVVGYMLIEKWDFFDAVYMTVITLSTVGYGEIHSLSRTGRVFTIVLVILGVGFTVYVAGSIVQFMVEGKIRSLLGRKRLDRRIRKSKGHYIVCGYGRIGRVICRDFQQKPLDLVVIEQDPELVADMDADGVLYICADATEEKTLIEAGIEHAKGLVAVLATDMDNVFLVLTARQLNADLFIAARAGNKRTKAKLLAAGANRVESPYHIGAASMAQRIMRPTVTTFLDFALAHRRKDIQMEEIPVSTGSPLVDVMLKDSGIRQRFNLIIIAIMKKDGGMHFNPSFESVIKSGDTVIAVGEKENLRKLGEILNPRKMGPESPSPPQAECGPR